MAGSTALGLVRGPYDYPWWANPRLFDVASALGEETARRDVGKQFSFPTMKAMFAHIYAADFIWLLRWKTVPTSRIMGDGDFRTMAALRALWYRLQGGQTAFFLALK